MRNFQIVLLLLTITTTGLGQNIASADSGKCVIVMSRLSENWKLDSTGNNGFRFENRKHLLGCTQPRISKDILLKYLGKPNEIREIYEGKQFLYYYYDFRTLPKGKDGPIGYLYIFFTFLNGRNYVSNIDEGDTDL